MNDTLEERLLTEQLHRVADRAPVTTTPVADDVRRGRGRLRRRRALVAVGSAAVVGALAGSALTLADSGASQRPALAEEPAVAVPPKAGPVTDTLAQQLESLRDDSGAGTGFLVTLAEMLALTEIVEDRLGGDDVLWTSAGRASSWKASGAADCPAGWTCDDVTVSTAPRARFASSGTVRQIVADLPTGVMVLTFNTVKERPAEVAYRID